MVVHSVGPGSNSGQSKKELERTELEGYLEGSRRVQKRITQGTAVLVPASLIATTFDKNVGLIALFIVLFSAGIGYYITAMHIAEWKQKLYELR